ncbi:MAG TPA: DUF2188 domain-containing protein [Burkholderiaceae bacterium]|nr:DUF2188 domain-containing protein [Burkholderiaceae bacterium]
MIRVRWRTDAWAVEHGQLRVKLPRQPAAVNFARFLAGEQRASGGLAQIVLHGKDGRIRWERTYGSDPRRARG